MRIAVFHNYLDNIGGAEIVALTLARELGADVYTTNIDKEKIIKMDFENILDRIFSIGNVPVNAPLKQQLSLWKFGRLNLGKKYDFYIIAGDWAISGVRYNKPNLCYVHSPIREIWDLYKHTRNNIVPFILRPFFDIWVFYNRYLNKKYFKTAEIIACNSENTKRRLKKFIGIDSEVVYPPIDTSKFKFEKPGNYWLSVNRLLGLKRVDMQINAFKKLAESLPTGRQGLPAVRQEKLIIAGSYEKAKHFKKYADYCEEIVSQLADKNVEIKNWVSKKELINLYANCKGFLTTSIDEDFGMNVVEAMASGKPVIAPNEGGYKETIINGKTGILIDDINEDKIIKAIKKISENPESYKDACEERAKKFDTKIFIEKIKNLIK